VAACGFMDVQDDTYWYYVSFRQACMNHPD